MESFISPITLYGENYDDFLKFLQMRPDNLVKEHRVEFCDLIYKHIENIQENPVKIVPPVGEDVVWLNTSRPLDFDFDLGNKVYVIDFFTYCCINCIHILPYLKQVETEYKNDSGFAVIGVHSPKFLNEKNTERVKDALILNDINHPVINDFKCLFWQKYGVTCWPTVFIVGPQNMLLFILVGETQIDKLLFMCQSIMQYYESCGEELNEAPVPVMPLSRPLENVLHFPSNVSTNNKLIVVSDTGHNCLLLMSSKLDLQTKIGSSAVGCQDGPFCKASFNAPHGTAWYNNAVFVADTGNHCIRKIDFLTQEVSTVFKMTGKVSDVEETEPENSTFVEDTEVTNHQHVFKSPWDICVGPELGSDLRELNVLYIAVAGSHQIWCLHMEADNLCEPFAGSGNEENRQNCYRLRAGFAQPSGIAYSEVIPEFLFVADSESSTIKSISLIDGSVKIVVGGALDPLDLFGFGDIDGKGRDVKLQHPMSVCVINSEILAVADTYNHKIKLVNLTDRSCSALDNLDLCEPSGMCIVDDDKLVIADTNNHRIKLFTLEGVASPLSPEPRKPVVSFNLSPKCNPITKIKIRYGGEIHCFFKMEDDHPIYSLTSFETPWEVSFEGDPKCSIRCGLPQLFNSKNTSSGPAPITIKANHYSLAGVSSENSQCTLTFTVNTQLCDGFLKVCSTRDITFKVAVEFSKLGAKDVKLIFTAAIFDVD